MTTRKPMFTMPPNALKLKVGDGGIPANLLKMGQSFLENNHVDFTPYANNFLEQLKKIRATLPPSSQDTASTYANILNITMQLKSNGSMFKYHLLTMVSDVLLRFLEKAEKKQKLQSRFHRYFRCLHQSPQHHYYQKVNWKWWR